MEEPVPVIEEPPLAKPPVAPTPLAKPPVAPTPLAKPPVAKPPVAPTPLAKPAVAPPAVAPTPLAPPPVAPVKKEIEEVNIDYAEVETDSISLKKPNDVYYELYKKAREKAKECRIAAIEAYLEAKQIKTKYMLFDEDDSDELSDDDIISDDEN